MKHWCNLIAYDSLLDKQKVLIAAHYIEPTSYKEAATDTHWLDSMEKEILALDTNHTWDFVLLPKGKKSIGCKWVYRIKKNVDGSIERYKDRLVSKGFIQNYGIDYHENFSQL